MSLSDDLAATLVDLGVTYRQLDHWMCQGYIPGSPDARNPGTGNPRNLTGEQLAHIRVMGELVRAGLRPDVASEKAAQIRAGDTARLGRYALTPTPDTGEAVA